MISGERAWSIQRATGADVEAVREILIEAATWLASQGIQQWRPTDFPSERIAGHMVEHEVFLAWREGVAAGTLRLQATDTLIWPEVPPGEALYLHGLAVRRGYAGLGAILLQFAQTEARRRGAAFLRLDCWSGNVRLVRYYTDRGFSPAGQIAESDWSVQRFEKRV